ncbi:MAG: diguanylate cyclase [Butyrivibrio sp.]|nr:diguanylate cyclase [Butyrivibrio sp.]
MRKSLSFVGLASLLLIIAFMITMNFFKFMPEYPIYTLEKGWTVTYHNQQYVNTNLEHMSDELGSSFSRGDIITLNHAQPLLPSDAPFPYLFLKTQFCAYEVFLDNELIYDRYMDRLSGEGYVGMGYSTVPLGDNYAGKRLTIKLYVTENSTRADIISPMIGSYDDLYRQVLHSALYAFFTSIFMIVFGLVFLIISLLFYIQSSDVSTQILSSILTTVVGVWMISSFDIIDFVIASDKATFIEYCCVYAITPLIYMIIYNLHRRLNNTALSVMAAGTTCFSLTFVLLHLLNIVHINHFEFVFYGISSVGVIILIAYVYFDIKSKSNSASQEILMLGVVVLTISLMIYAMCGMFTHLADYRQSIIMQAVIPTGAIFFVITQLLNYFIFMTRSFAQRKEYAALSKIAYVDNLTGLPNRASCDRLLMEYDESQDDFCLISMDLNGLKEVNDNSGHPAGDRLLKSFSAALSDAFKGKGTAHRVGGDEFLVLIRHIDKGELDQLLKDFTKSLKELDKDDPDLNHSVSFGYAFRSETEDKDTHSVSVLADKRMYENKKYYHSH